MKLKLLTRRIGGQGVDGSYVASCIQRHMHLDRAPARAQPPAAVHVPGRGRFDASRGGAPVVPEDERRHQVWRSGNQSEVRLAGFSGLQSFVSAPECSQIEGNPLAKLCAVS